jgi:hypothetical protein
MRLIQTPVPVSLISISYYHIAYIVAGDNYWRYSSNWSPNVNAEKYPKLMLNGMALLGIWTRCCVLRIVCTSSGKDVIISSTA